MPIITREEVEAYVFCAQQVDEAGALSFDDRGQPYGDERCPGYAQQKVRAIRELIEFSYLEGGADATDPVARMIERGVDRLDWFDRADEPCPHCGYPRMLSEQQRPQYASLAGVTGP